LLTINRQAENLGFAQIRLATRQDLESIYRIEDRSFSEPYPHNLLAKLLSACPDSFLVAELESEIVVGYCVAAQEGSFAHLISLAVLRDYRRRGVGIALIQAVLANLGSGVKELRLEVKQGNADAVRLYRKLGFELVDIIENYYADGSAAVKMRLTLPKARNDSAEALGK